MSEIFEYTRFVISIFAIVNPLSVVPAFITLTSGQSSAEQSRTARTSTFAAGAIMTGAFLAGDVLLRFFGVSVSSFRIAGGILLLLIAISMMQAQRSGARQTAEEADEALRKDNVAVVPIAIPLLSGPGTISYMIILSHAGSGLAHFFAVLAAIAIVTLSIYVTLRLAAPLARVLGKTGLNIAARIMGILLAAIAVEFMMRGLLERFPSWGR